MKRKPAPSTSADRRRVSWKKELPPSITMSPGSRCGNRSAITWSTARPACTMSRIGRGGRIAATSSGMVRAAVMGPSFPNSARKRSVRSVVRL
jgi:hypothetical protein